MGDTGCTRRGARLAVACHSGGRLFQTANLVSDSRVLVAGGYDAAINPVADTYLVTVS